MSLISLAANHCRTAHASISSGATVVQNISLTLAKSPPIRFCGGTFGCTEVHAQMKMVKIQLHATPNSVLGGGAVGCVGLMDASNTSPRFVLAEVISFSVVGEIAIA